MSAETFFAAVEQEIASFESVSLLERVRAGTITVAHYHSLLRCLFHQVRSSSWTFAEAAIHMPWKQWEAKHYLLKHAYEEATHWQWINEDLASTGYDGPAAESTEPPQPVSQYIALNQQVARETPLARLAIAMFLEGVGGALAERHGRRVASILALGPQQMQFFLGHSVTDAEHSLELAEILRRAVTSDEGWTVMEEKMQQASRLYAEIYRIADASVPTQAR